MNNLYTYKVNRREVLDAMSGGFITEKGKYKGVFTKAEHVTAKSNAVGVSFDFKDEQGRTASFSLYTFNKDGEPIFGHKRLQSIMTCLRLNEIKEPKSKTATVWDSLQGKRIEKEVPQFLELLGKPIGLLLVMEEYQAGDGSGKWRPAFEHAFEAETELMADEIMLGKVTPERLGKEVQRFADKPLTPGRGARNASLPQRQPAPAATGQSVLDDFDDDIPF